MSSTDREDTFVLVGRNNDIEVIGPDCATDHEVIEDGSTTKDNYDAAESSSAKAHLSNYPWLTTTKTELTSDPISKLLQSYFKSAPVPLHLLSGAGIIIWANDSELRLVGYTADEYIGHEMVEFLFPGEDKKLLDILQKLRNHESVYNYPIKMIKKSGETHRMLVDTNATFENDGSFAHARCFIKPDDHFELSQKLVRDKDKISRKHAESRTAFIRNVFHEIRTPMHALSNFFCDSNPTREDFEDMKCHTESILGIVDDLAFSTAFEAGEATLLSPVRHHLPSVLAEMVESVNAVEQKAGGNVQIRLHCSDIAGDVDEIVADPFFRRVLFSLLSNAVKFSPAGGVVDVSITHSVKTLQPRAVGDTGVGQGPGSVTSRRHPTVKAQEPFVTSLSSIPETASETTLEFQDSNCDYGYFTFHFRNSTVTPMNVSDVSSYFKSYYHSKSNGYVSLSGSVAGGNTAYASLIERPYDRRDGSVMSRCSSSPNFKDLQVYSGLGVGLYAAYNMVTLMGGTLECAVEDDNQACFWFSVPSCSSSCDTVLKGSKIQGMGGSGSGGGGGESPLPQPPLLPPMEATTTGPGTRLFLNTPVPTPTPSFAVLSHTSLAAVQCPSSPDSSFPRCMPPSVKSFTEYNEQRVLVVDDSRICQKVAGRTLSSLEFTLDYASNGLEAVTKLSEKPLRYDAVLMDLRMPVMDGLTAIRMCRTELGLTKLPIVALTAEVGASIKDEAMRAGANWFLTKPAKTQELVSVMRALSFTRQ